MLLMEVIRLDRSYKYYKKNPNELNIEKFNEEVKLEMNIYSKDKIYSKRTKNFSNLEKICYAVFSKSLVNYAINNLNYSWRSLCKKPPRWYYNDYKKLKEDLLKVCNKLGHFPTVNQCREYLKIGFGQFKKHGGYMKVRSEVNYNEDLIDDSGYINKSHAEYSIAQFLIHNKIKYNRDVLISPNPNVDGSYNCDFVVENKNGENLWIEFWGLVDRYDYNKKRKIKEKLYKKYNLNLVNIECSDYHKNSFANFQKLLLQKIKIKNMKSINKTKIFINYNFMSNQELYHECLDKNKIIIPISLLGSKLIKEIYKRYKSYDDLLFEFTGKIKNNSKLYREKTPVYFLEKCIIEENRILNQERLKKKFCGLDKYMQKNKGKAYWEIKTYIKFILENRKIPKCELRKLKKYYSDYKCFSGHFLNKEAIDLLEGNRNIIAEVI